MAVGNDDVTHPQVHDRTLYERDGHVPIRNVLCQGRLCNFLWLVLQVLSIYNAGSANVWLED